MINAKQYTTDAIKTASKKAVQKTADLSFNRIGDKITNVSKEISTKELHNIDKTEEDVEITTHKKDTYLQKKDNKLLMN